MNLSNLAAYAHYSDEMDTFLIHMKDRGLSPMTQKEYLYDLNAFLISLRKKPIQQATKLDVMRFLSEIREGGASERTRNRKLMSIRTFFRTLKEFEMVKENPTLEIQAAKTKKNELPTYLDESTLKEFISYVPRGYAGLRNIAIFMLAAYAGLRVVEIHNANTYDLDRVRMGITVLGKGNKPRYIPLKEDLFRLLLRVEQDRMDIINGGSLASEDQHALFLTRQRTRISRRQVQHIASEAFETFTKIPKFSHLQGKKLSFHKLRHSFSTALAAKIDIRTLQELLGHENLNTTMIYSHVVDKQKEDAIAQLDLPSIPLP